MSPDNLHIVSLGGFVDYTSDQGKRIKTVFAVGEGDRSAGRKGTFLDADNAWEVGGYGSDFFDEEPGCDRGDDPIDDFSVEHEDPFIPTLAYPESPPDVPTFGPVPMVRLVMKIPLSFFLASGERNDRILIRSEFDEAEAGALSAARGSGPWVFLVTGQPGIGEPFFPIRLLIRRRCLKLPTVLQLSAGLAPRSPDPHQNIWALVDSNTTLGQPAGMFTERSPFFVVEASSHRDRRLEWMKKAAPEVFYLKPWTFSEVAQARTLMKPVDPPTERELRHLYRTYGASCRQLFQCAKAPHRYQSLVQTAVETVDGLMTALISQSHVSGTSHFVALLEPSPTDRAQDRSRFITQAVFELVWRRHLEKKSIRAREFYELFVEHSFVASSAGWLFEFRMHTLLREGHTLKLFPIRRGKKRDWPAAALPIVNIAHSTSAPFVFPIPRYLYYPLARPPSPKIERGCLGAYTRI